MLLTNSLGEIDLTIGNEISKVLIDTGATLSVLNPLHSFSILFLQCIETIQVVEVSSQPMTASTSLLVPFQPGPIQETH